MNLRKAQNIHNFSFFVHYFLFSIVFITFVGKEYTTMTKSNVCTPYN